VIDNAVFDIKDFALVIEMKVLLALSLPKNFNVKLI
jgi:hypothetical protein